MKTFIIILSVLILSCLNSAVLFAQSSVNYTFSTLTNGSLSQDMNGNTIDMSSGTTTLVILGSDNVRSSFYSIGFEFYMLYGTNGSFNRHTSFTVNSNGVLRLGEYIAANRYNICQDGEFGVISPFARDLATHSTGKVHYKLVGSAPNRCLVVEWKNMEVDLNSTTADATYQARIYETSGIIELVYGAMNVGVGGGITNYQIGISNDDQTTRLISVQSSTNTISTVAVINNTYVAGATIPNLHSTADGSRRVYRFTPPTIPTAPTAQAYSNIQCNSARLNWTDNATNEVQYEIYQSANAGGPFVYIARALANSTNYTISNLTENTTYYYRIRAVTEGTVSAFVDLGAVTTTAVCGQCETVQNGNWNVASTWLCGHVPFSYENAIVKHNVTITADMWGVNDVTIQNGGNLLFNPTNAIDFQINGDLVIDAGGTFYSAPNNTSTLNLYGNMTVNGDYDGNRGTSGTTVQFLGINNQTLSGTGATCDFYQLRLNKGNSIDPILEVTRPITLREPTAGGQTLELWNGTFKLSSASTLSAYHGNRTVCGLTSKLWLNHANAEIKRNIAGPGAMYIYDFQLDAGKLTNVGDIYFYTTANNENGTIASGTGSITVNGKFTQNNGAITTTNFTDNGEVFINAGTLTTTGIYLQDNYSKGTSQITGGTFSIATNFDIENKLNITNGNFTIGGSMYVDGNGIDEYGEVIISGGTFNIGDGNDDLQITDGGKLSVSNATINLFGRFLADGIVTKPTEFTASNATFNIDPQYTTNLINTDVVALADYANVNFTNSTMTIVDPELTKDAINDNELEIAGTNGVKNFTGSTINFGDGVSTSAQGTITGTRGFRMSMASTASVYDVVLQNPAAGGPYADRNLYVSATSSTTSSVNNFTLPNSNCNLFLNGNTLKVAGDLTNNGNINGAVAGSHLQFTGTNAQSYSGTGTVTSNLQNLTFNNTSATGVTLNSTLGANTINLTDGHVYTSAANMLTVYGTTPANLTGSSASNYVVGPLTRTFAVSGAANYNFPIGSAQFQQITLNGAAFSGGGTITANVNIAPTGGTPGVGLAQPTLTADRYWELYGTATISALGSVNLTHNVIGATDVIGQSTILSGVYDGRGGLIGGGNIQSVKPLALTPNCFFIINPAMTLSGNYDVGASRIFKNLTDVAQALKDYQVIGDVRFLMQNDYDGTDALGNPHPEIFPIDFTVYFSPAYTVTIRLDSAVTARETSNGPNFYPNPATALIHLNGIDKVKFDGCLYDAAGNRTNTIGWTFRINDNFNNVPTFLLSNDAQTDTLTYLQIEGNTTTNNRGVVWFSTASATGTGNDNNAVTYCNITGSTTLPPVGIYSLGTATRQNSNNLIDHCNVYDIFYPSMNSMAIFVADNNTDWTISNNRCFQTTPKSFSANVTYHGICVYQGGGNYLIENNTIGYASSSATGTMVFNTNSGRFIGIQLTAAGGTNNTIQNNLITAIDFSTSANNGTGGWGVFSAIYASSGNINILNNTIGSMTATDAIRFNVTSNAGFVHAISNISNGTLVIRNNNIGGMSSVAAAGWGVRFLLVRSTRGNFFFSNNTIGGLVANSIYNGVAATTGDIYIVGVDCDGNLRSVISNNIIRNFSCYSTGTTNMRGIFNSSGTNNLIDGNVIHSFKYVAANSYVDGIYLIGGTNTTINNSIQLGIDAVGNSTTAGYLYGIRNNSVGISNFFHNSVYIGGTVAATARYSYAFYKRNTVITADSIMNNIFVNERSGVGTHYCFWINFTTNIVADYNIYGATGTGGVFASIDGLDRTALRYTRTFMPGQDLHSGVYQSGVGLFANATGNVNTVDLHLASPSCAESMGTALAAVTDDYDGENRAALSPTDIGADASNSSITNAQDIFTPNFVFTPLINTPSVLDRTFTITITDQSPAGGGVAMATCFYRRVNSLTPANIQDWDVARFDVGTVLGTAYSNGLTTTTIEYTIHAADMPLLANEDVIEYYFVAQDQATVTANPNIWYSSFYFDNLAGDITPANGIPDNDGPWHLPDASTLVQKPILAFINTYAILGDLHGTYYVGAGPNPTDFWTLTGENGFFQNVNSLLVSGDITAIIQGDIEEPGIYPLLSWNENPINSNFHIRVVPLDDSKVYELWCRNPKDMIRFEGADSATIDGSYNGAGRFLEFRNQDDNFACFKLSDDATYDTIKNCIIEAPTTLIPKSVFWIFSGITTGNDFNVIEGNLIDRHPNTAVLPPVVAATVPAYAIYSFGSLAGNTNSDNKIVSNEIRNFGQYGVWVATQGNGDNWTITSNSMYYSHTTTPNPVLTPFIVINVQSGSGHNISNNRIGGETANNGGVPWTVGGATFRGIEIASTNNTLPNILDNNVIQNLTLTNVGGSFNGISLSAGLANITNNTIGHTSTANSIHIVGTGTSNLINVSTNSSGLTISNNLMANILATGNGILRGMNLNVGAASLSQIQENEIRDIYLNNSGAAVRFTGIELAGANNGRANIIENTIGSTTNPTSIRNEGSDALATTIGIFVNSSSSGLDISNNTVSGIQTANNNTTTGIYIVSVGNGVATTISNNTVSNIINNTAGGGANAALRGIAAGNNNNCNINLFDNTLRNLENRGASYTCGIQCDINSNSLVHDNRIEFINASGIYASSYLYGIRWFSAAAGNAYINNNTLRNLYSASIRTNISSTQALQGIYFQGNNLGNVNIYENLIYDLENSEPGTIANHISAISLFRANVADISYNTIYNIQNHSSQNNASNPATISGITVSEPTAAHTIYNNMIALSNNENAGIHGLWLNGSGAGINQIYYNSFFVGGTSTGNQNSFAFLCGDYSATSLSNNVQYINNIFHNERNGSGKHYAIGNQGGTSSWGSGTPSYNNLYSPIKTTVGFWNNSDRDFYNWQINSTTDDYSVSSSSDFVNPAIADLHLNPNENCANNGRGTPIAILVDYDGDTRDADFPDIGADEFNKLNVSNDENFWLGATDNDWNKPSNWGCGLVPVVTSNVTIPSVHIPLHKNPVIYTPADVEINQLTIYRNGNLTLNPVHNLTLNGSFSNDGFFTIKSDNTGTGSFIDNGTIAERGISTVERWLSGCDCNYNYHYVGSPFQNSPWNVFNENIYEYNEGHGSYFMNYGWLLKNAGTLTPSAGYNASSVNDNTVSFVSTAGSTLNTGAVTIPLSYSNTTATPLYEGWNFVSNPYPSTIDWDDVSITKTNLENTIYFWNGASYSYYISAGGTNPMTTELWWNYVNDGTQYVPEMQGFFVKARAGGGSITFNNGAREHRHGANNGGFWKKNEPINADYFVKLLVTNGIDTDETVVHFSELASDSIDDYDAYKFMTDNEVALNTYTITTDSNFLAINSLPLVTKPTSVPLFFESKVSGNYTFKIVAKYLGDSLNVFLEDKKLNITINLNEDSVYTFLHRAYQAGDRFVLHFKPTFKTPTIIVKDNSLIYSFENKIYIDFRNLSEIGFMEVYNLLGQNVFSAQVLPETINDFSLQLTTGEYIVKVVTPQNFYFQKIFLN